MLVHVFIKPTWMWDTHRCINCTFNNPINQNACPCSKQPYITFVSIPSVVLEIECRRLASNIEWPGLEIRSIGQASMNS
jgi:hypothetical protein